MLLSLTATHRPAGELGFLLHKHPSRFQTFDLSFGKAHFFYPEVADDRCTACLLLDVDAVDMVRGAGRDSRFLLGHYVNDRPYTASSFMSVALAQLLGSALQGRCKDRPELAATPIDLTARLEVLAIRGGGESFLRSVFEPLGYMVSAEQHQLDEEYPDWGDSQYFSVTIQKTTLLSELLTHLYVLIPVFDYHKHYFVGQEELEKLLARGEGWLACHPQKEEITRRYLKRQPGLSRQALARLAEQAESSEPEAEESPGVPEEHLERLLPLHDQRLGAVLGALKAGGVRRVLDLGCGEGNLLRILTKDRHFEEIVGVDVSLRALELARKRLRLDQVPPHQASRIRLLQGSLTYRDRRLHGFDGAAIVEVVEHLDPPRLAAFERVVFEFARPGLVVITTPNREYNAVWESLPAGKFRHPDHRFEWTRQQFQDWGTEVANRFGYTVRFVPVGPDHAEYGTPTQMGIFEISTPPSKPQGGLWQRTKKSPWEA